MVKNEFSVQLSEECFNVCETLKTKIPGGNVEDLSESVRIILEDLEECVDSQTATLSADISRNSRRMRNIKQSFMGEADAPNVEYNKEMLEEHKLVIHEALGGLDENLVVAGSAAPVVSAGLGAATIPVTQSGASAAPHSLIFHRTLIFP